MWYDFIKQRAIKFIDKVIQDKIGDDCTNSLHVKKRLIDHEQYFWTQ